MDAVKFIKEKGRMCNSYNMCSGDCPIHKLMKKHKMGCSAITSKCAEEVVVMVEGWSKANPVKTRKDDFFEKHPKASKDEKGYPIACPLQLGYLEECCVVGDICKLELCWDVPVE